MGNDFVDLATDFEFEAIWERVEDLNDLFWLRVSEIYSTLPKKVMFSTRENWKFVRVKKIPSGSGGAIECGMELMSKNDRICITNENSLIIASARFSANPSIGRGLRLAHVPLLRGFTATRLEECSSYIDEYVAIALRSQETGLIRSMTPKDVVNSFNLDFVNEDYDIIPSDESSFYWSLLHVMLICCSLAGVVFFMELVVERCPWMKKIKIWYLEVLS